MQFKMGDTLMWSPENGGDGVTQYKIIKMYDGLVDLQIVKSGNPYRRVGHVYFGVNVVKASLVEAARGKPHPLTNFFKEKPAETFDK